MKNMDTVALWCEYIGFSALALLGIGLIGAFIDAGFNVYRGKNIFGQER
jgi:hypothetical protein